MTTAADSVVKSTPSSTYLHPSLLQLRRPRHRLVVRRHGKILVGRLLRRIAPKNTWLFARFWTTARTNKVESVSLVCLDFAYLTIRTAPSHLSSVAWRSVHGRPHIGANGVSWPPWKNGWKISENMQKRAVFYVYVISWEQSEQAGVENDAMLITYLFRYTSEWTIS